MLSYSAFACKSSFSAILIFSLTAVKSSRILSLSRRNALTSLVFKSSFNLRYSLAFSDCFSNGPTCFSSSDKMSFTRTRLSRSCSSFFIAAAFLLLNFTIPAASSKSSLLSSGLPLNILSI